MDIFFNLLFLVLAICFAGDFGRDLHFNSFYKWIQRFTEPVFSFLEKIFPIKNKRLAVHLLLLFGFLLLRAAHYYSYRTDIYSMQWGPAVLIWNQSGFLFAIHKALIVTTLFYVHFMLLFYLFEWISGGTVMEPFWKLFRAIFIWIQKLIRQEGGFLFLGCWILGSLLLFLMLFPAIGNFTFIPKQTLPWLLPVKISVLNLFLASKILHIYFFLLFIRVLLSWIMPMGLHGAGELIYQLTEPVLTPFYRLPLRVGPIDFSVLLASFVALFLYQAALSVLARVSYFI